MSLRRLTSLLLALLLCALLPAHAGTTYTFAGKKFDDCTLNSKIYSCTRLPLSAWDDSMVIGKDYTVNVSGDVYFGYNQGLSMSGGATLTATGNLDIGGIAPALLQVNGAVFVAGKQFSMGAQQQTIVADIRAATMQLGTGSTAKITGTISATGAIAIGSNVTIVGPVSGTAVSTNSPVSISGDVNASTSFYLASHSTVKGNITAPTVETNSPVTITGNVTASRSFTLASGSTMTGNVKSDVVQLLAASVTVNGNIEATTSLRLGSSDVVNGSVSTGELTLDASDSRIVGSATVDHATLEWAARVTDTIVCRQGSTPGKCDCVTNNSGYAVRNVKTSGNGPWCEGGKPQAPDHFLIAHEASASVCAPTSVTVTACANAACSATYGGGATVYLQPSNQPVAIGANGIADVRAQLKPAASVTLGLAASAGGSALPANCRLNGSGAASNCTLAVSDATLALDVNNKANAFTAGEPADLTVTALVFKDKDQACKPLFQGVQRDLLFSFGYDEPRDGSMALSLGGQAINPGAAQAKKLSLAFDQNGKATAKLSYSDAGRLKIDAKYVGGESSASGSVLAVAAPASFRIAFAGMPNPLTAGSTFQAQVQAVNALGAATPNFGRETQPVIVDLAAVHCAPAGGRNGFVLPAQTPAISGGAQQFVNLRMDEVGSFDLKAGLPGTDGYLGSKLRPTGTTNTRTAPDCSGASGLFAPAWFKLASGTWERKATADKVDQYYSDERAIALTLSAVNKLGVVTENYAGKYARDVDFTAADPARKALAVQPGDFLPRATACTHTLCAADFVKGVATWKGGYKLATAPAAPATIRVRATESRVLPTDNLVTSAAALLSQDEPLLLVRSGRVRIASNYIGAGKELALPVSIEYWDGRAWVRNVDDSTSAFPSAAFALATPTPASVLNTTRLTGPGKLKNGYGELKLTPPAAGAGVAYVALNLGGTAQDNACVFPKKTSTGNAMPFLRAPDATCKDSELHDPWARATFGVFTPERKRVIHVREVFR